MRRQYSPCPASREQDWQRGLRLKLEPLSAGQIESGSDHSGFAACRNSVNPIVRVRLVRNVRIERILGLGIFRNKI